MKYILSIIALFAFMVNAQEPAENCGTHTVTSEQWEEFPELREAYNMLKENALNGIFQKNDDVLIIPIVFHVVHEYGTENISDAQIYDALRILNEDYRKLNADTSLIIGKFKEVAGDAKIEFRLASIDPFGNPTNGITRHFSHETNIGDDYSKFEQWPRGRYINVWTVKSMKGGVAGYAYYPTGVEGNGRFRDGIIIRHNYIGSIGTSDPYSSRALTHEIGHYLGLAHLWGSTNDPGLPVNCTDDDGIEDTPNTIGWTNCNNLNGATCDTIIDNIQNFMEYSYCTHMFTKGQITYMRNILNMEVSQRNNLWTEENKNQSIPEGIVYTPIADFYLDHITSRDRLVTCVGEPVKFKNWSWRLMGTNQNYTWTFEDGSVETSTDLNPTVSFTSPGWKDVTLTVEQDGVTHTVTKEKMIWVSPNWSPFSGPHHFTFDDNPDYWVIQNPQGYPYEWEVKSDAGVSGSGGIFLNTTNPYTNPVLFTNEYFFNDRRGGSKHSFVSQAIDATYLSNMTVSFDYAAATNGFTTADIVEELKVFSSTDSGKTWVQRKKLSGTGLINNGSGWDVFYPSNTTIWSTESFTLPSSTTGQVFIKFEYTGSDKSNNIAIDNIIIDGTLSTSIVEKAEALEIYPNPSNQELGWNINYDPSIWGGASVKLTDMAGRTVAISTLSNNDSTWNIKPQNNAANGIYILEIRNNDKVSISKVILK